MSVERRRGTGRIVRQVPVARGYREIRLEYVEPSGSDVPIPRPGEFFTILPPSHPMRQMRRPFAYSDADTTGFSFIYEIRGDATRDIAALPDGAELDWIGPLGSAFPAMPVDRKPVLVAGGIGLGPILYLARHLSRMNRYEEILLAVGARNAELVPELSWPPGVDVRVCTDDGTAGIRGTAMAALANIEAAEAAFFTCGPIPRMKAVHELAVAWGSSCWVSMEEMMACGVGACQGCAVEMAEEGPDGGAVYTRACVEGPVFDSREVAW